MVLYHLWLHSVKEMITWCRSATVSHKTCGADERKLLPCYRQSIALTSPFHIDHSLIQLPLLCSFSLPLCLRLLPLAFSFLGVSVLHVHVFALRSWIPLTCAPPHDSLAWCSLFEVTISILLMRIQINIANVSKPRCSIPVADHVIALHL